MSDGFLDTNVIVRLVTGDDPGKQARAAALLARVEADEIVLEAPVTVVADAIHVLSSRRLYALPREDIAEAMLAIVQLRSFRLTSRTEVARALVMYRDSRMSFGDAMLIAAMEIAEEGRIYTYDRDFDGFAWVTRLEP